mmetsp:Transcript_33164/g.65344  ORF Transcript_33164/g.65344 Transcript_33164/m.65344 type:complete len:262 (+) Transcript_33164:170-955(+)
MRAAPLVYVLMGMWRKQQMGVLETRINILPQPRTELVPRMTAAVACGLDVIHGPVGQHRNMISIVHIRASHRRSTSCTCQGPWPLLWAAVSNSHFCCSSRPTLGRPLAIGLVPHDLMCSGLYGAARLMRGRGLAVALGPWMRDCARCQRSWCAEEQHTLCFLRGQVCLTNGAGRMQPVLLESTDTYGMKGKRFHFSSAMPPATASCIVLVLGCCWPLLAAAAVSNTLIFSAGGLLHRRSSLSHRHVGAAADVPAAFFICNG